MPIFFYIVLVQTLCIFPLNASSKNDGHELSRIWIIRHCDKAPENSPCCSSIGRDRSVSWYKYFEKYIAKNRVKLISSKFDGDTKVCGVDNLSIKSSCQKSQRMYLTSLYMMKYMKETIAKMNETIDRQYCSDSGKEMIENTLDNKYIQSHINDIIISWESTDINNIINHLGVPLSEWPSSLDDVYDVVFLFDIKEHQLYYDCYNFLEDNNYCPWLEQRDAMNWIGSFKKVSNYYSRTNDKDNQEETPYPALSIPAEKYIFLKLFVFIFVISLVFFTIYLLCKNWSIILSKCSSTSLCTRNGYNKISDISPSINI